MDASVGSNRVVVALDHHFVRVNDRIYTELAFGFEYWREYLEVFDEVNVFARVRSAKEVPACHFRADGPGVNFLELPDYRGPYQFCTRLIQVFANAWRTAGTDCSFILRSGTVADCLWLALMLKRRQYAREIQGMVGLAMREATTASHPIVGPAFACLGEYLTRLQMRWASAASYVGEACRGRYPTVSSEREFVFSSVRLDDSLVTCPRSAADFDQEVFRLISVGRLEPEKGHRFLVEAISLVNRRYPGQVALTAAGGGSELESLRQQVRELDLENVVRFLGPVKYGPQLFALLDNADLFVLPSLTEGMPRALIEAMARGLPAIGSRTGGISEILNSSQLLQPRDTVALADAIGARIGNRTQLEQESHRNFNLATTRFSQQRMRRRKHAFWSAVSAHRSRPMAAYAVSE